MEKDIRQMNTVHERDLNNLLEKLGVKEKFEHNELQCKFCKQIVNKTNIYSILPESGAVNLICDKPECISSFFEYLDEKKKTELEQ